jgi:hypothetical protein
MHWIIGLLGNLSCKHKEIKDDKSLQLNSKLGSCLLKKKTFSFMVKIKQWKEIQKYLEQMEHFSF